MFHVVLTDSEGNQIVAAKRTSREKAQAQADAVRAVLGNYRTGNAVSITVEDAD